MSDWIEIALLWVSVILSAIAAKKSIVAVAAFVILLAGGCAQASSPPEKQEKKAGAEPIAAPAPEPKKCSDLHSPQDLVGVQLTAADKRSLAPMATASCATTRTPSSKARTPPPARASPTTS